MPFLIFTAVASFLVRWILNWRILYKQDNANYSLFRSMSFEKYFDLMKHGILSEWILYWENRDNNNLKRIANILSGLTIFSLIATAAVFKYSHQ